MSTARAGFVLWCLAACGPPAGRAAPTGGVPPRGDLPLFTTIARDEDWSRPDHAEFFARFDLLLVSRTPGSVAGLRARNPRVRIFANVNPYFALGAGLWPDHALDPETVRPDWVLRDPAGAAIHYHGPLYPGMDAARLPTLMDVRHLGWQQHFLATVLGIVATEGFDGVFLDTMTASYPEFARTPGGQACRDFSAAGWKRSADAFLALTRERLAPDKQLLFNGLSLAPGTPGDGDLAYLGATDGACYEAFGIAWPLDQDEATRHWYFTHTIRTAMVRARRAKKCFLLQVTGDEDDREVRLYALCAFLLERYDGAYFYFSRSEAQPRWFPEWGTRLGSARGEAHEIDGLWVREYEHGTVRVNPGSRTVHGLPPFTGRIGAH